MNINDLKRARGKILYTTSVLVPGNRDGVYQIDGVWVVHPDNLAYFQNEIGQDRLQFIRNKKVVLTK